MEWDETKRTFVLEGYGICTYTRRQETQRWSSTHETPSLRRKVDNPIDTSLDTGGVSSKSSILTTWINAHFLRCGTKFWSDTLYPSPYSRKEK